MKITFRKSFCIVSGGQTGVDRAALDAAMAAGVAVGGWCPEGRLAEDGPIDDKYPLKELKGGGYPERTRQNVVDSDGTAIIFINEMTGGTRMTYDFCLAESKPCILINRAEKDLDSAVDMLDHFISSSHIRILNVAGPRASKDDEAYGFTYQLIDGFLN